VAAAKGHCDAASHGLAHQTCPIHGVNSRRSRSFAANIEKNVFRCFHCGAQGNVLDLWAAIHKSDVYRSAISLCEELGMEPPEKTKMQP
jgi:DNA primase